MCKFKTLMLGWPLFRGVSKRLWLKYWKNNTYIHLHLHRSLITISEKSMIIFFSLVVDAEGTRQYNTQLIDSITQEILAAG